MRKGLHRTAAVLLAGWIAASVAGGAASAAPLQPVDHVGWMNHKGLVMGVKGGDLALEKSVTLAEAVTVFARVHDNLAANAPNGQGHWALPYLKWAEQKGLISAEEASQPDRAVSAERLRNLADKLGYRLALSDTAQVSRKEFFQALGDALTVHITIAHTNDVHGHIEENPAGKEFGYAKIATLVSGWRRENPNTLLIDAGDTFQGTVFVNQFKGESIVPILNYLGYETMAAGNHDFDFGYQQLLKLRDMLKYPILSANVFTADGKTLLAPTYRAQIGGKTFAFIGLVAQDTPILTHPDNVKGLTFRDPVEVAKQLVPALKKEADHVIVVSHVGIDVDRQIAKEVPGIDLIIGGHSHTPLRQPEVVNGTYIVQDWEYGKSLGRADLYYYGNELVGFSGGLLEYDDKVPADPEVDKLVKEIAKEIDSAMNVVIARSEVDLDGDRTLVRTRETNIGDLIADVMRERTQSIPGHEADAAITNGGGIRTQLKAGDITKKDLYTLLPFPNTLVVVEVTGAELKQALENGVSQVETGAGRFPQVSGITFTYDPKQPAGQRVLEVKVGGQPLDPNKTYRVATNDFLASGGDGYEMLKKNAFNTGITLYSLMEEYLMQQKVISPKAEGRIVEVK